MKPLAVAVLLLLGAPAAAQPASGTTPSGIYYEVSGTGTPVVLAHAFSVDRRMWESQIRALETSFRVVRYDLRGHGRSAAPSGLYSGHADLREVLDALQIDRAAIVGLSAGSEVAVNFALTYPGRIARLVLASPGLGGYRVPPLPWASAVFQAAATGDAQAAAKLWSETPIMALQGSGSARDTIRSLVMDNWRLWTYRRTELPLMPPAVNRLAEIKAPALVIVGAEDLPYIKDIGMTIANGVASGRLTEVAGARHFVNFDTPEEFNRDLLAFLRQ